MSRRQARSLLADLKGRGRELEGRVAALRAGGDDAKKQMILRSLGSDQDFEAKAAELELLEEHERKIKEKTADLEFAAGHAKLRAEGVRVLETIDL